MLGTVYGATSRAAIGLTQLHLLLPVPPPITPSPSPSPSSSSSSLPLSCHSFVSCKKPLFLLVPSLLLLLLLLLLLHSLRCVRQIGLDDTVTTRSMGLFIHQDGHMQGWLAALLCCCAAMGDDETYRQQQEMTSTKCKMLLATTTLNDLFDHI